MDTPSERARFEMSVARLLKLIRINAPNPILAGGAMIVFQRALILFEKDVTNKLGEMLINLVRAEAGQCRECGAEFDARKTFQVYCNKCQIEFEVESFKTDMEFDDGES